jgi:hypothetical protein
MVVSQVMDGRAGRRRQGRVKEEQGGHSEQQEQRRLGPRPGRRAAVVER